MKVKEKVMARRKAGLFIRRRRKELGLNQDFLAKELNYKDKQAISNIERGVAPLPFNRIIKLAQLLGVERKKIAKLACLDKESKLFHDIEFIYLRDKDFEEDTPLRKKFLLPILRRDKCSKWTDLKDLQFPHKVSTEFELGETTDTDAWYALAEGEIMTDGNILPGDLLLIEPNHPLKSGNIVLAVNRKGYEARKYIKTERFKILQPLNPAYDSIILPDEKKTALWYIAGLIRKLNT
ncbi:MAG: helix-turn-helix domain-containing protein [Candidatus Aminicenantes bacterium]|nr:helix-turn-helix domain-containing protein [Candidatus Aminicenantes bacterium]MDH5714850.1 helix-turn-helix domain-containing protein [Candidatus Aminicenantes bacterium]